MRQRTDEPTIWSVLRDVLDEQREWMVSRFGWALFGWTLAMLACIAS